MVKQMVDFWGFRHGESETRLYFGLTLIFSWGMASFGPKLRTVFDVLLLSIRVYGITGQSDISQIAALVRCLALTSPSSIGQLYTCTLSLFCI